MLRIASLLSMLITCSLFAQPMLWQENGISINQSRDYQYDGNSVRNDDGSFLTAWTETNEASHDIWAIRMDGNGDTIWDAPRKILDIDLRLNCPEFIRTSDGNLMLSALRTDIADRYGILIKMDWECNTLWEEPIVFDNLDILSTVNCEMLPDDIGGVYLFISDYNYPGTRIIAHRIGPDGDFLWDEAGLDMFDGQESMSAGIKACPDGEGGFVVCTVLSYRNMLVAQRVLPDGSTPWGDDGFIELGEREYNSVYDIIPAGEGQFALLSSSASYDRLILDRIDINGNEVTPYNISTGFGYDTNSSYDYLADEEGNVYVGWTARPSGHPYVRLQKFDSENNSCWYYTPPVSETSGFAFRNTLRRDEQGYLYQSWFYYEGDDYQINLQRYDPDGDPLWGPAGLRVINDFDDVSMHGHLLSGENSLLFWMEQNGIYSSFKRQLCTSDACFLYDDEDMIFHSGIDDHPTDFNFGESENRSIDRLYYSWVSSSIHKQYLQSIDTDGEVYSSPYGIEIIDTPQYFNSTKMMIPWQDDVIIFWLGFSDNQYYLTANRFDLDGNRAWDHDLVLDSAVYDGNYPFDNIIIKRQGDAIFLGWEIHENEFSQIKIQKIVEGEVVWDEPLNVGGTLASNSELLCIEDDYILWSEMGFRVLRLQEDGSPYDGWDPEGHRVTRIAETNSNWNIVNTEEGLVIVWLMRHDSVKTMRLQVVSQSGAMRWFDGHPIATGGYMHAPELHIEGKDIFVFWRSFDELYIDSFNMHGEPLWDSRVTIARPNITIEDIAPSPDGFLIGYRCQENDDTPAELALQHVDFRGNLWPRELPVCTHEWDKHDLNIIRSTDSRYFLVWEDDRNTGSFGDQYVQYLDYHSTGCDEDDLVPVYGPNMIVSPNPFNPETSVRFSLKTESNVALKVYNVKGQLVRSLCDERLPVGEHAFRWDGHDGYQKQVSSGVYLLNLDIDGKSYRRKALMLK